MTADDRPSALRLGRRHIAPTALGRALRRRALPSVTGEGVGESSIGRRELVVLISTIAGMAAVVSGPVVWVVAVILLLATTLGVLQLLGRIDSAQAEHGVAIESLIVPAVAAFGAAAAIRLVPLGPAVVPALLVAALVVDRAIAVESRLTAAPQGPTAEDRSAVLVTTLVVALVAFGGVAAIVPGGLAGLEPPGAPATPLGFGNLVVLAAADAAIAGLLGYRAVALRVSSARDAAWAAASFAAAIAIGAAAVRAIGIPRLVGPALLMFLFYLWDSLHAAPPSRRRDPRWIWETAFLAGLGIVVVAWNLRIA